MKTELKAQSPCGLVVFKKNNRFFVITFSYGHAYLDGSATEGDFGLRVAVNSIKDNKIRGVERSNLGLAVRDFAQAAGQRELSAFGIEDALDLIRKVSGHSAEEKFADMVTGARALRFSKNIELSDVPETAEEALTLFNSKAYKKTPFAIIDSLSPVVDPVVEARLNDELVLQIISGSDEFEIGFPEFVSDQTSFFKFESAKINGFYPDLSLDLYRQVLGEELQNLTFDKIKHHKLAVYDDTNPRPIKRWSVFQSLVGSLIHNGQRYALNEGNWYKISNSLKDEADQCFKACLLGKDANFEPFLKKIVKKKGRKPKEGYEPEEAYNLRIAESSGYVCLDRKLVPIPNVAGQGIEVCDLLDIAGRRFIHIKKNSRSSSLLSHLFKQGSNSAQTLRSIDKFRTKVAEKIRLVAGPEKAQQFEKLSKEKWTVEFRIADTTKTGGNHDIPFFSKLSFKDERARLASMGFDVGIGFITLPPLKLKTTKKP